MTSVSYAFEVSSNFDFLHFEEWGSRKADFAIP